MRKIILAIIMLGTVITMANVQAADEPWRGTNKAEKEHFVLGMMNAYAEAVRNRVKILGLGEPLSTEETDAIMERVKMIATANKVGIYREPELLVTDLFPASITESKHVILIYTDDTLDKYLQIKADKKALVDRDKYVGEARKDIARRFGHLLSYSDDAIEQKISGLSQALDQRSYLLGTITEMAGVVSLGLKPMGISSPRSASELDPLISDIKTLTSRYNTELYRETDFLTSDLFPVQMTEDKVVLLIYQGSTLDEYMALKQHKAELLQNGQYSGSARTAIARSFGKLLGYSDALIDQRLAQTAKAAH